MFAHLLFSWINCTKSFLLFSGYVANTNSFPKPLTKEEEEYYLGS